MGNGFCANMNSKRIYYFTLLIRVFQKGNTSSKLRFQTTDKIRQHFPLSSYDNRILSIFTKPWKGFLFCRYPKKKDKMITKEEIGTALSNLLKRNYILLSEMKHPIKKWIVNYYQMNFILFYYFSMYVWKSFFFIQLKLNR